MKKNESNVSVSYYNVSGYRYIATAHKSYNFDAEQTAVLDKILPLIASGDYEMIGEICGDFATIPF